MSEARKVPAIRAVRAAPKVRRPKREKKARAFDRCAGAAAAARSRATVVLPSGIALEGLAVEDAVKAAGCWHDQHAQSGARVRVWRPGSILRKQFNGLSGLVRNEMKKDPLSGALDSFTNR